MLNPIPSLHRCSLTLYAFHSYRSNNFEQPDSDANELWNQLSKIGEEIQSPVLQNFQQELLTPNEINHQEYQILLKGEAKSLNLKLPPPSSGALIPFRLHKSYAADLTLARSDVISLSDVEQLNPQKQLLLPSLPGLNGQTLVLFAKPNVVVKDYSMLAKDCIEKVFQDSSIELIAQGRFLDGLVFEFDNKEFESYQQRHALVWFSYQDSNDELIEQLTERLLFLLYSRHTLLYAYRQSRECDRRARATYSQVETRLTKLHEDEQAVDRLERLKKALIPLLQDVTQYAKDLRDLSDHENTVTVNIENFDRELSELSKLPGTDVEFLKQFSALAKRRFLRQIEIDRKYLEPGLQMIQQGIDAVRGLTEIEQAEIDRRLGQIIQVVGVGLAAGSIVGSGSSYLERPFKPAFSTNTLHPFVLTLLVSFLAAFLAGLVALWTTRPYYQRWSWFSWLRSKTK